jgi:hypothetical protein
VVDGACLVRDHVLVHYGEFPFFVLDQSALQDGALLDAAATNAQAAGGHIAVTEIAILELQKSSRWQRSIELAFRNLSRHPPELFIMTEHLGMLLMQERIRKAPVNSIVSRVATDNLRLRLRQARCGDPAGTRAFWDDFTEKDAAEVAAATAIIADGFPLFWDFWKRLLTPLAFKDLRSGFEGAFDGILFSNQFLTFIVNSLEEGFEPEARDVSRVASISGLFQLCLGAWTLDWIAQGGAETAGRAKLVNDGADLMYVMYALLGRDLVAGDQKAKRLFRSLRSRLVP